MATPMQPAETNQDTGPARCPWARNPLSIPYHDNEWGVPVHDDRLLFEFLVLEGAQAGLSWDTILKKRGRYREVFDGFDANRIARYTQTKLDSLMGDPGIVRNRLKIKSAVLNAQAFLRVREEFGSFDQYIWSFIGGKPRDNQRVSMADAPVRTAESDAMSKDLWRRNFKFVGSTICHAYMQAVGMVNDHLVQCFRHAEIRRLTEAPDPRARSGAGGLTGQN